MTAKIEVTIDGIIHATEDTGKILGALEEVLGVAAQECTMQETTGHFENPIRVFHARLVKQRARRVVRRILDGISEEQAGEIMDTMEQRIADSKLHVRLGKQGMIGGRLELAESDSVRVRIHTPIYNKKGAVRVFSAIMRGDDLD